MEVQITADQEAFVRQAIATGRYQSSEDATRDAMLCWKQQERTRLMLSTSFDEAENDLDNGRLIDHPGKSALADELKSKAREFRRAS